MVRVGEPVRVRGGLRGRTLRVLVDQHAKADSVHVALEAQRQRLSEKLKELRKAADDNRDG